MSSHQLPLRPGSNVALKRKRRSATPSDLEDEDEQQWGEWNGFEDDDPMPVPADSPREKRLKQDDAGAVEGVEGEVDDGDGQSQNSDAVEEDEKLDDYAEMGDAEEVEEYCDLPEDAGPKRQAGAKPDEFDIADNEDHDESQRRYSSGTDESGSDGDESSSSEEEEEDEEDDEDDLNAASAIYIAAELSSEESDLDTMAYFWNASYPDTFLPDALQPRATSTLPLPFSAWGKRLKAELATLSHLVDSSTAVEYIQEAYSEREGGQDWLVAADVREAAGKAMDDGCVERPRYGS